jgi:hypothetical protein
LIQWKSDGKYEQPGTLRADNGKPTIPAVDAFETMVPPIVTGDVVALGHDGSQVYGVYNGSRFAIAFQHQPKVAVTKGWIPFISLKSWSIRART